MKKHTKIYSLIVMVLMISLSSMHASLQQRPNPWGTSLHKAVFDQKLDHVIFFVSRGWPINAQDFDDFTPLHRAVMYNSEEIVKFLIDAGADLTIQDSSGSTPLLQAIAQDKVVFARMLIEAGSSLNTMNKQDLTPLTLAVYDDRIEMVKMLIEHGALKFQDIRNSKFIKLIRSKQMKAIFDDIALQQQQWQDQKKSQEERGAMQIFENQIKKDLVRN